MEEAKDHEKYCHFKNQPCPLKLQSICNWTGYYDDLVQHFRFTHPQYLVTCPIIYTPNTITSSQASFLTERFNFLFLTQFKYSAATCKLYICTRLLGNKKFCKHFKCFVRIKETQQDKAHVLNIFPQDVTNNLDIFMSTDDNSFDLVKNDKVEIIFE